MRAQKISTKFLSSLWKTPRKSDQLSPKIGALNETDSPFRQRPARRFRKWGAQTTGEGTDSSYFSRLGDTKLRFAPSACSVEAAASSPSPVKRNNARKDGRTAVTSAVAFGGTDLPPKHGNGFFQGTVNGVTHPEAMPIFRIPDSHTALTVLQDKHLKLHLLNIIILIYIIINK